MRPDAFDAVIGAERAREFERTLAQARRRQGEHTLWHVNSTSSGGGVAEMLHSILGYLVGAEIRCRWLVIEGSDEFFTITKRIHHLLHGKPGDGAALDEHARDVYEDVLRREGEAIAAVVRPGDTVILNDPQTLGLAPALRKAGAKPVFTCHIGADVCNEHTRAGWSFLAPYVADTERQVFSRRQFAWDCLDADKVVVIPPCLDAFSPKNQELAPPAVSAILAAAGIVPAAESGATGGEPTFTRPDGTTGTVRRAADLVEDGPIPADALVVTQVSRWDSLKDHAGVMTAFVEHVPARDDVHLVLAGPALGSVSDDPESTGVLTELRMAWKRLPADRRSRVHLVCLPMDDGAENGAMVNALQRRSDIVVQKSLAEGFGLTVAEAMWKGRATVGSRVGGIQDQIEHGRSGLLLDDPRDPAELGAALRHLIDDGDERAKLGLAGHEQVVERYLAPDHLSAYLELVGSL
jgi:trehalose synthase